MLSRYRLSFVCHQQLFLKFWIGTHLAGPTGESGNEQSTKFFSKIGTYLILNRAVPTRIYHQCLI